MAKTKPMYYKDDDGKEYKISYSEKLQMKNLAATRRLIEWNKIAFYGSVALILILLALTVTILYTLYRLDAVDFFTRVLYR